MSRLSHTQRPYGPDASASVTFSMSGTSSTSAWVHQVGWPSGPKYSLGALYGHADSCGHALHRSAAPA